MLITHRKTASGWPWHVFGQIGTHYTCSHFILESSFYYRHDNNPRVTLKPFRVDRLSFYMLTSYSWILILTTDMTTSPGWPWHPFEQIGCNSTLLTSYLESSYLPHTLQQPRGDPDIPLGRSPVILHAHILFLSRHSYHRHDNILRVTLTSFWADRL